MKRFIGHTYTVVVLIGMVLLSILADTDLPYALFILILMGFALVWSKGWKWEVVGLKKPKKFITLLLGAMLWALGIVIFSTLTIPLLEHFFGKHDLSFFDPLRGNTTAYLLFLLQIWVFVAFFEEFAFRGYLMLQLERLFGHSSKAIILAVLLSSIIFGMGHNYQGVTGIILTGTIGGILGISYYVHKRNLWMPVLIHGFVDTIYISLVYTDLDIKIEETLAIMLQFIYVL